MNGRLFLDTNAIIALMSGNYNIIQHINKAEWIGISIVSEIQFLSFSKISERDRLLFQKLKSRIEVVDLQSNNEALISLTCSIRIKNKLKLPDAVIAASAVFSNATVVSNDKIFSEIGISNIDF